MSEGPNGQKRPAETVGAAAAVGRVATGNTEEGSAYVASPSEKASVGGKARAQHLSKDELTKIAKAGAEAQWNKERRADMTHEEQLMNALFGNPQRELIDIKFFVSQGLNVSREDVCREAVKMLEQMDAAQKGDESFSEDFEQKDVRELFAN